MQSGTEFLRAQVEEAAAIHSALVESMVSHESEANDARYRDLCDRHLPHMRQHELQLAPLRETLGNPTASNPPAELIGAIRKAAGSAFGVVRSLADAPSSDYQRLAGDLDLVRRLEVTFKIFRDAGRTLHLDALAKFGEMAERHHDEYSADAKRLLLAMFIERAHTVGVIREASVDGRADSRIG
jgi:hypothetical protein